MARRSSWRHLPSSWEGVAPAMEELHREAPSVVAARPVARARVSSPRGVGDEGRALSAHRRRRRRPRSLVRCSSPSADLPSPHRHEGARGHPCRHASCTCLVTPCTKEDDCKGVHEPGRPRVERFRGNVRPRSTGASPEKRVTGFGTRRGRRLSTRFPPSGRQHQRPVVRRRHWADGAFVPRRQMFVFR